MCSYSRMQGLTRICRIPVVECCRAPQQFLKRLVNITIIVALLYCAVPYCMYYTAGTAGQIAVWTTGFRPCEVAKRCREVEFIGLEQVMRMATQQFSPGLVLAPPS